MDIAGLNDFERTHKRPALPGPAAQVLDVASGTGYVALAAAPLGHQVTAIDLALAMLARNAAARGLPVDGRFGGAVEPGFRWPASMP